MQKTAILGQNLPFPPPPNCSGADLVRPGWEWEVAVKERGFGLWEFYFRKFGSLTVYGSWGIEGPIMDLRAPGTMVGPGLVDRGRGLLGVQPS